MNHNLVHKNILKFAVEEVSRNQFELMLGESSAEHPMYISWTTNEGNNRRYKMYWEDGPLGNGIDGGSDTKAAEGMWNLQGDYPGGDWRTLDTNTVTRFSWKGKFYRIA